MLQDQDQDRSVADYKTASTLAHYVKLLGTERESCEQQAAAHGLWMMASKCRNSITEQPGCVDGNSCAM